MNKMNYTDFVKKISKKTGYAQKDVKEVLNTVSEVALDLLREGTTVNIVPSITLEARYVAESTKRNPRTGETVLVAAHKRPKAKFGKLYKDGLK